MRFPEGNALDQEARSLHGNLALYDGRIAGLLTRLVNREDIEEGSFHIEGTLKNQLDEYGRRRSDAWPFVEDRLRYLDEIHWLIRISKERAEE